MQRVTVTLFAGILFAAFFAATVAHDNHNENGKRFRYALIGDLPYNDVQSTKLDRIIANINDDERFKFTIHVGDIKSGSSLCDDATFQGRFAQLQQLEEALLYTPGDNEWTDCHYPAAGRFQPLERLAAIRKLFYPEPGFSSGGRRIRVLTQGRLSGFETFVENSIWLRGGVVFATLHVVGSHNDLIPWSGIDAADSFETPRSDRIAEFQAREAANLFWLEQIFKRRDRRRPPACFLRSRPIPTSSCPSKINGARALTHFSTSSHRLPCNLPNLSFLRTVIPTTFGLTSRCSRRPRPGRSRRWRTLLAWKPSVRPTHSGYA